MSAVAVQPEPKQLCKSKIGYSCYIREERLRISYLQIKEEIQFKTKNCVNRMWMLVRLSGLFVQGSSLMKLNGIKLAVSKLLQWLNNPSLYWTWQYTSTIIDWTQGKGLYNPDTKDTTACQTCDSCQN